MYCSKTAQVFRKVPSVAVSAMVALPSTILTRMSRSTSRGAASLALSAYGLGGGVRGLLLHEERLDVLLERGHPRLARERLAGEGFHEAEKGLRVARPPVGVA